MPKTPKTLDVESITATPGAPASWVVTHHQIGMGVRMNLGARDYAHDDPNGVLMFRIGAERSKRRAVVKLNGSDLYDIEIGRLTRDLEYVVEAQETDLYADMLGEALIRMHHAVTC